MEIKDRIKSGELKTFQENNKSDVWQCFLKIKTSVTDEIIPFVMCKFCYKIFKFPKHCSTTNLRKHKCYMVKICNYCDSDGAGAEPSPKKFAVVSSEIKNKIINDCVNFVAKDLRSFESVAGEGFKSLAQSLLDVGAMYHGNEVNVDEVIPHPTTVSRHLTNVHKTKLQVLIDTVKPILEKGDCAATLDTWTEENTQLHYLTVTVHFVDGEWELCSRILFTTSLPKFDTNGDCITHSGEFLAGIMKRKFVEMGLREEFFLDATYTTDQGSNVIKALKNCCRMNCAAHLLNTILRNVFDNQKVMDSAKSVFDLISRCKSLVEYLKRTGKKQQLPFNIVQECTTRWSTKFQMLLSIEKNFPNIEEVLSNSKESDRLIGVDRQLLNKILSVLEPFKNATLQLEGDKQPTLCKVLYRVCILKETLQELLDDERNDDMKTVIKQLLNRISEKFQIQKQHKIAAVLWPAMKQMRYLENSDIRYEDCVQEVLNEMRKREEHLESEGDNSSTTPSSTMPSSSEDLFQLDDEERFYNKYRDISTNDLSSQATVEFERYKTINTANVSMSDILPWWRKHSTEFPLLSKVAKKFLAIPATSAASERSFSTAGRVIEKRRSRLKADNLDAILFLHSAK